MVRVIDRRRPALLRRTVLRVVAVSSAMVALAPADPATPAQWSEPRSLGPRVVEISQPAIAFERRGRALLSWRTGSVRPGAGAPLVVRSRVATLGVGGATAGHGVLQDDLAAPPVVYGHGRVVLLHQRTTSTTGAPTRVRLSVSFGTIARPEARRAARLVTYARSADENAAIAANDRGEVAVAWVEFRGKDAVEGPYRVRVATRRPGHRFGRPETVAEGYVVGPEPHAVTMAYGAGGDLLVAYAGERPLGTSSRPVIAARARRARGGSFGREQVLGPRQGLDDLDAAVAPDGRMVVTWGTQDGGEVVDLPYVVRGAIREVAATRFDPAQVLDPGAMIQRTPGEVALAMASDGEATVIWSNATSADGPFPFRYPLRVATAPRRTHFGAFFELSPSGVAGDVVTRADSTTLVTWRTFPSSDPSGFSSTGQILAALRPPGAENFGPPETVTPDEPLGPEGPRAAFDPRTGMPTLIWATGTNRPPAGPLPAPSAVLRFATRTP